MKLPLHPVRKYLMAADGFCLVLPNVGMETYRCWSSDAPHFHFLSVYPSVRPSVGYHFTLFWNLKPKWDRFLSLPLPNSTRPMPPCIRSCFLLLENCFCEPWSKPFHHIAFLILFPRCISSGSMCWGEAESQWFAFFPSGKQAFEKWDGGLKTTSLLEFEKKRTKS